VILNLTLRIVLKIFLMYSKNVLDVDCQTQGRLKLMIGLYYRVSQNLQIPNSERGREGSSGARKILRKKKIAVPKEAYKHFNFVQYIAAFISTVTKYYSSYVAVPFLRKVTKMLDFVTPK
jgi:hypothetical protein